MVTEKIELAQDELRKLLTRGSRAHEDVAAIGRIESLLNDALEAAAEADVALFNSRYKVGHQVSYWTGVVNGPGCDGEISYPAAVIGGTPCVYVLGKGAVALTHVIPAEG